MKSRNQIIEHHKKYYKSQQQFLNEKIRLNQKKFEQKAVEAKSRECLWLKNGGQPLQSHFRGYQSQERKEEKPQDAIEESPNDQ